MTDDTATLYCVQRLGETEGLAVVELVERLTGEPCPCRQGKVCPVGPRS